MFHSTIREISLKLANPKLFKSPNYALVYFQVYCFVFENVAFLILKVGEIIVERATIQNFNSANKNAQEPIILKDITVVYLMIRILFWSVQKK
jgi:hypothetical protein